MIRTGSFWPSDFLPRYCVDAKRDKNAIPSGNDQEQDIVILLLRLLNTVTADATAIIYVISRQQRRKSTL